MQDLGDEQSRSDRGDAHATPAFAPRDLHPGGALPLGTRLQEFEVAGLIGEGGFSIVYRARDTQLGRAVALKEYLPASLARRDIGLTVVPRSARHAVTFQLGLNSFINEAQLLASFDHPSLVKVYRFWEQNGTAYMVMPLYEGRTLIDWLRARNAPADEAWLRALLAPLLDALELMHGSRCYHRDIAPDNVLLLDVVGSVTGTVPVDPGAPRPVLLDFGAARRVIGNATQALTAILKPGFAPIEQYSETTQLRQGPWTDVYALCALLYHAVTGRTPMPSVGRLVHDELVPAATVAAGRYSTTFLRTVDAGMAVQPKDRPQSMRELRAMLDGEAPQRTVPIPRLDAVVPADVADVADGVEDLEATRLSTRPFEPAPDERTVLQVLPPEVPPPKIATASRRRLGPVALSAAAVVIIVTAAVLGVRQFAPGASVPEPAAAPAAPFSVLEGLRDIVRGADPQLKVDVRVDKPVLEIDRDPLRLKVRSSQPGHVYVYAGGTEKSHFYLLFPNRIDADNRIAAGTELALPRASWTMVAGGPPGVNEIVVLVSRSPRDMSGTGIASVNTAIPEFDLQQASQRWAQRAAGAGSPFIGVPACGAPADCPPGYGATMVEVTEVAPPR